jgi:two-component system OmpR family sensor kinase
MRAGRLSSRQRLTLQITTVLFALWPVIGFLTMHTVERRVYADLDERLTSGLPSVARAAEVLTNDQLRDLTAQAPAGAESGLLIVGPRGVEVAVPSGHDGKLDPLPDLGNLTATALRSRSGAPWTVPAVRGPTQFRVAASPLPDGRVLVQTRSLTDAREVIDDVRAALLAACFGSVLAAIALVWLITRQTLRPLEAVIATAHDVSDGTLEARVVVDSTAPDVVRLASALNVMLGRLQDELARRQRTEGHLRQFVADASHELRTPLAAVIGFGELYQQHAEAGAAGSTDRPAREEMVRRMLEEADRMQRLVDELLTLARLDEGLPLARDAVDLDALVSTAVTTMAATSPSHDFVLDATPTTVMGDRAALRQLVDNLLVNVVNHTPVGTTARVDVARDGDAAVLRVTDDGPGLSPDDATHAFERFWRARSDRARPGGTGLGLAIVAELAGAHGGTATIVTGDRPGLTVEVRLPAGATAARTP